MRICGKAIFVISQWCVGVRRLVYKCYWFSISDMRGFLDMVISVNRECCKCNSQFELNKDSYRQSLITAHLHLFKHRCILSIKVQQPIFQQLYTYSSFKYTICLIYLLLIIFLLLICLQRRITVLSFEQLVYIYIYIEQS